ncbi:uncharacterized protein LOC112691485 [Sipha flava]|uniref:Uncharacterized protein LOC112691485 n=1 Tax=Sipha flava TaxID=143950 RepID=A0A8B8GEZ2_9HEMI|nr:uncharacterized protein LOC112691485 [Sipha flava]
MNGTSVPRTWLIYSPSGVSVFCYICKFYAKTSKHLLCKEGYSDWHHITERLIEHENSTTHRNVICDYSNRSVELKRTIAVIQFGQRGLAFFGENEILGNSHNGNFLGIMELIAKFDPFLKEHLNNYGNKVSGKSNYISPHIIRELISLMADKVLNVIVEEIKNAKYFGLIVDSTPDVTHIDQLAIVLRYVKSDGQAIERFIKFIDIYSHNAEYLTSTVIETIKQLGLNIENCVVELCTVRNFLDRTGPMENI